MPYWLFTWCRLTLWKNEKFTLTEIIFRQINSLVIYLVNALLSRNFCQKSVRVNFRNFHTVHFWFKIFQSQSQFLYWLLKPTIKQKNFANYIHTYCPRVHNFFNRGTRLYILLCWFSSRIITKPFYKGTDMQPIISRLSADYRPIISRLSAD